MNRMKFLSVIACLVVLGLSLTAAPLPIPSQKSQAGKIMGTLLDVNDARVTRAKIRVEGAKSEWQGESDEAGDFTAEVPVGEYRIYVSAHGFRKFESPFLKVKPDVIEMVNIHLEVQPNTHPIPVESNKQRPGNS
jgi:hypothetical protein